MKDSEISSSIDKALLNWLFEVAPFGVLATDLGFKISWVNGWFRRSAGQNQGEIAGRDLFAAFPDLLARGFDRYYRDVAAGQTRVLSHRFHKYLIPMKIGTDGFGFAQMQQSARISPLISNDSVIGTITVIDDVSERVAREAELQFEITRREELVESEISARALAEENARLKGSYDALRIEGIELMELGRERDKLIHRIIQSQEEERTRIARDIHDHFGQQLTALRFALTMLMQQNATEADLTAAIEKAHSIAEKLDSDVDYLSWNLRPAAIDDIGLEEALKTFVRQWSDHYDIPADFHSFGFAGPRIAPDTEINLYRIAQESLNNVFKHAGAKRVSVLLENRENDIVLIVEDDGVGFNVAENAKLRAKEKGMGLFGMRERATLIGGSLEIESKQGDGTSVYARVPASSVNS